MLAVVIGACAEERASPDATPGGVDIAVQIPDSGTFVDFQWATRSGSRDTLRARLQAYIAHHGPIDGAFEDAVHVRFYRIAHYRLARLYYHAGLLEQGDSLLQRLEETDAEIR
jgi:hypothetical protein